MAASATKLSALRSKLDQLGFNQTFGQDSFDIVDRLLKSFVKLSEVYQLVKKQSDVQEERIKSLEGKTYPAEAEASRLLRENNQLHEQIVLEKQNAQAAEGKLVLAARKEQDMKKDMVYLLGAKETRIQVLLEEGAGLKNKLETVVRKSLDLKDAGSGKLGGELRKKVAEVLSIVDEIKSGSAGSFALAASLKRAEQDVVIAKSLLIESESEKQALRISLEGKDQAIIMRDREIRRLQAKTEEEGVQQMQVFWNRTLGE